MRIDASRLDDSSIPLGLSFSEENTAKNHVQESQLPCQGQLAGDHVAGSNDLHP